LHIPLGGTSLHPGLYGLAGLLLGKRAIPVVYVTLLFQSLIFQHGGLISLGVNTLFISSGALCGWLLWDRLSLAADIRAGLAGFFGVLIPALLVSGTLTALNYGRGMLVFMLLYIPAAMVEGVVTLFIVRFFKRTQPGVLNR
jgi:cobalt/nickel transport system permease protein